MVFWALVFSACTSSGKTNRKEYFAFDRKQAVKTSGVLGFGFLYRIPGLWNGPVTSDTPAGHYPVWYVDFRPTDPARVSEFSTVTSDLCNYITFFIVKHAGRLKVAMRTDARFKGKGCITYEVMQEADENQGDYKFSDCQSGDRRAYTIFKFRENSFVMRVYTNKFNKLKVPAEHSVWKAKRVTMEPARQAIEHFNYPRPVMVHDFSTVFGNRYESIYFKPSEAPFQSKDETYVGNINFRITVSDKLKVKDADELFLMLTTKPIFTGMSYDSARLNYISKFVYLPVSARRFTMRQVHPGTYYLYSYIDINGDKKHKRGDYMASKWEHVITVPAQKSIHVTTHIDYVIP